MSRRNISIQYSFSSLITHYLSLWCYNNPMTQTVFSPAFWDKLDGRRRRIEIAAVDRGAHELAVGAIFSHCGESVIWLNGENEPLAEKKEKIGQWLKLLGRENTAV